MLDAVWRSIDDLGATLTEVEWKQPTELPGWSGAGQPGAPLRDRVDVVGAPVERARPRTRRAAREERLRPSNENAVRLATVVDRRRRARRVPRAHRASGSRGSARSTTTASTPTRGHRKGPGTVRTLLPFRIFDSFVHEQDMRRAVDKPGDLESAAADLTLDTMVGRDAVRGREESGGARRFHHRVLAHRSAPARSGGSRWSAPVPTAPMRRRPHRPHASP